MQWAERKPISVARDFLKLHPFVPVYSNLSCPFSIAASEQCYGEVTEEGYEMMLQNMPPPGSPCALTPDSEFLDIGSGYGRLAMYVRMRSNISRVTGVEINHCRHKKAVRGRAKIDKLAGPELLRDLELIFGDVRALSLGSATHIFMSIQCWGSELIEKIISHLVPRAPHMRCMIFSASSAKFVLAGANGSNMNLVDRWGELSNAIVGVPTSWTPTEALYVGKRSRESASEQAACERERTARARARARGAPTSKASAVRCGPKAKRRSIRHAPSSMDFDVLDDGKLRFNEGTLSWPAGKASQSQSFSPTAVALLAVMGVILAVALITMCALSFVL